MAFVAIDARPRAVMLQRSNTRLNWPFLIAMALNLTAWYALATLVN
jgi:hypothetical protein